MYEKLMKSSASTRRQFITAAAGTYLGVHVLGNGATAWAKDPQNNKAQSVIYIYLAGGASHMDTWDPKPGKAEQGPIKDIKTKVPGTHISELLPMMAKQMDKIALIRSMNSREGSHERGTHLVHTSYPPWGGMELASMGAWTCKLKGKLNQTIPNYVLIGGRGVPTEGIMGPNYSPAIIGDVKKGLQHAARPTRIAEVDYGKTLTLIDEFDADFRKKYRSRKVDAYNNFYNKAVKLMASDDIKAFDIGLEDGKTKERYGNNGFGQGLILARRLVEAGARFIEVVYGGWDMHNNHAAALRGRVPALDRGLSGLIEDLNSRGLLKKTLVVVASEFGRTPKISQRNGRDHWPKAWSHVLAGGGVKGGAVYGATDATASTIKDNPVTPQDFNATIAYALGVKHDAVVHDEASGRPFRMGGIKGAPITKLF